MSCYKTLMLPVSPNDLSGVQGWLQGLAVQGLILDSCTGGFRFRVGESARLRYRIDPRKGHFLSGAPQSLRDMYAEYGWTYIDTYNGSFHVFVTDDPEAVEPFSTTESLIIALEHTKKKQTRLFVLHMVCNLCFLWFWISRKQFDFLAVFNIILIITGVPTHIYHIRTLLEQEQQLKGGVPLNSPLVVNTHPTLYWGRIVVFLLLFVFFLYHIIW